MPNLTRRSLFALGGAGAAGLAVSGCGTEEDPRAEGRDVEILESAANAEALLAGVYATIGSGGDEGALGKQLSEASSARSAELERIGSPPGEASASVEDYPAGADAAENAAIAAYRDCVRLGSTTEIRSTAIQFLAQVAAEQATLRGLQNKDQSPTPFVTGLDEEPYVASADDEDDDTDEDAETTSTTSSTSSTTTSTGGDDG